jgi:ABC-2 type transport system ATP-binding protein
VRGRVLAQIVDEASGKVLGNQITPVALRMDGRLRRVTLPLEIVAATARRGQRLTLQIVARSSLYDTKPKGGTVRLQRIRLSLPTVQLP